MINISLDWCIKKIAQHIIKISVVLRSIKQNMLQKHNHKLFSVLINVFTQQKWMK